MYSLSCVSRRALFLLAVLIAATWVGRAQAEEPLRWKFAAGQGFDYQMKQDMTMNMNAGPAGQMATSTDQNMSMTWNIKSVDDKGSAVVEQKVERIQMKMSMPGGQGFDYDSSSEQPATGMAAMVAPMFKAMTAGTMTFTMSPRGEISDVKLSDELAEAIKNGPGGGAGGVDQFKAMASQAALTLPENPPKQGDTWTNKVDVAGPAGGKQTVETTYTYDGTRDVDGATFAVIKPSMKLDLGNNPAMQVTAKDQKTEGEILFDVAAGQLHSMSLQLDITLEMSAAGQTMPGSLKQNIDVTLTPKK